MFFASLGLFAICAWGLPWWMFTPVGVFLGWMNGGHQRGLRSLQIAAAAALAILAAAFVQDGRSSGLIAKRMAGVFGLPHASLMFVMMALFGAITATLGVQCGIFLRQKLTRRRASDQLF